VFLDDFVHLTGTFLGDVTDHCCCKRFSNRNEFILIQLTRPVWKNKTLIPAGTLCAIQVNKIAFIIPGNKHLDNDCHDIEDDCSCDKWDDDCHKKQVINIKIPREDRDKTEL